MKGDLLKIYKAKCFSVFEKVIKTIKTRMKMSIHRYAVRAEKKLNFWRESDRDRDREKEREREREKERDFDSAIVSFYQ